MKINYLAVFILYFFSLESTAEDTDTFHLSPFEIPGYSDVIPLSVAFGAYTCRLLEVTNKLKISIIVRELDGGTYEVPIRLAWCRIDKKDKKQLKLRIESLLRDHELEILSMGGRGGRIEEDMACVISVNSNDLNEVLLKEGLVAFDAQITNDVNCSNYSDSGIKFYQRAEESAQSKKLGMWRKKK